jgi:hypothetical protein
MYLPNCIFSTRVLEPLVKIVASTDRSSLTASKSKTPPERIGKRSRENFMSNGDTIQLLRTPILHFKLKTSVGHSPICFGATDLIRPLASNNLRYFGQHFTLYVNCRSTSDLDSWCLARR